MDNKFQGKYRIPSARWQHWDYRWSGAYFITICTKNREHYFGEIENGTMQLSEIGKIVEYEWLKTPNIRPDMNIELGPFIVMPNHFHAIIYIGDNQYNRNHEMGRDAMLRVSTTHRVSTCNKFRPQCKNLASIVRGFKSAVTTNAKMNALQFGWQSRFHDHVIRNNTAFDAIQNYIITNVDNWNNDLFFGCNP